MIVSEREMMPMIMRVAGLTMAVTIFGTGCASMPNADIDPALDPGLVLKISDQNGNEREISNVRISCAKRKRDQVLSVDDGSYIIRIPLSMISKVSQPEGESRRPTMATITLQTGEILDVFLKHATIFGDTDLGSAQINMNAVREIVILSGPRKGSLTTP